MHRKTYHSLGIRRPLGTCLRTRTCIWCIQKDRCNKTNIAGKHRTPQSWAGRNGSTARRNSHRFWKYLGNLSRTFHCTLRTDHSNLHNKCIRACCIRHKGIALQDHSLRKRCARIESTCLDLDSSESRKSSHTLTHIEKLRRNSNILHTYNRTASQYNLRIASSYTPRTQVSGHNSRRSFSYRDLDTRQHRNNCDKLERDTIHMFLC